MTNPPYVTGPWRSVEATKSQSNPGFQFTGIAKPDVRGSRGYELTETTAVAAAKTVEWMFDPKTGLLHLYAKSPYEALIKAVAAKGLRGDDEAIGSAYSDRFQMGLGNDKVYAYAGNDHIDGGAGNDILHGQEGNDTIIGGAGIDRMYGGEGNDVFYVDQSNDIVVEGSGTAGGFDTVFTVVSYVLGKDEAVERLAATGGSAAISLTGNRFDQTLEGNAGANILDGGTGGDTMVGGAGNDTYVVDNARDRVVEAAGGGTDVVRSSVSFSLGSQAVENLVLLGTAAINGTGNGADNAMTGNNAANVLQGLGGDDRLVGGAGADRLLGGAGMDVLLGGIGDDRFEFDFVSDSGLTSATRDQILDFTAGDRIDLITIDANATLSGDQAFLLDANGSFSVGEIRQTLSGGNLLLEFNTDADAAAEMSLLVLKHGILTFDDFYL